MAALHHAYHQVWWPFSCLNVCLCFETDFGQHGLSIKGKMGGSGVLEMNFKHMDVKTVFLNSPLEHALWVRFPACYKQPLGRAFA